MGQGSYSVHVVAVKRFTIKVTLREPEDDAAAIEHSGKAQRVPMTRNICRILPLTTSEGCFALILSFESVLFSAIMMLGVRF